MSFQNSEISDSHLTAEGFHISFRAYDICFIISAKTSGLAYKCSYITGKKLDIVKLPAVSAAVFKIED
jgi:hypothetical protein